MAAYKLSLRVISLFGCDRIKNYVTKDWILNLNNLKKYFAFIHHPFETIPAMELAWQSNRYDLLAKFIAQDCQFNFIVDERLPIVDDEFKKILDQRRDLHRSISEKNIDEVSRILDEILSVRSLSYCYNELNDSAVATALRHFDVNIYALLLDKKLKFCRKCEHLLLNLPRETRKVIAATNMQLSKPLEAGPDYNPLMSKCWVTVGHFNLSCYSTIVNILLEELEKIPESRQLLRLAEKCPKLKIVFDFKSLIISVTKKGEFLRGMFNQTTFVIYVSAKRIDRKLSGSLTHERIGGVLGTLAHELAHFAMQMLYQNICSPFGREDTRRQQEFEQIVTECRSISETEKTLKFSSIISFCFQYYESVNYSREFIVLVPQILCEWAEQFCSDLDETKTKFPKIFEFYKKYVVADIDSALEDGQLKK